MLLETLEMRIMCAGSRAVARRQNTTPEGQYHTKDGGGGDGGTGQFLTSLHFRNSMLVHEIFELGGKISHDSGGSEVKGPLKVLLLIKHPNVDLNSEESEETSASAVFLTLEEPTAATSPNNHRF